MPFIVQKRIQCEALSQSEQDTRAQKWWTRGFLANAIHVVWRRRWNDTDRWLLVAHRDGQQRTQSTIMNIVRWWKMSCCNNKNRVMLRVKERGYFDFKQRAISCPKRITRSKCVFLGAWADGWPRFFIVRKPHLCCLAPRKWLADGKKE